MRGPSGQTPDFAAPQSFSWSVYPNSSAGPLPVLQRTKSIGYEEDFVGVSPRLLPDRYIPLDIITVRDRYSWPADQLGEFGFREVAEGQLSLQTALPHLTVVGALNLDS